jgi:predicted dehydrogenase
MKLAVIGAGYWGPNLVRVFSQHPRIERVTVCDIDPKRLERISQLHPTVGLERDAESVLADRDIDAVVVALPVAHHYSMARRALEAGKHVLVEKPLASTAEEGEALCRLAAERERVLMVGHTFLFNAAVRKIKSCIDSGELGEVYYVYAQRLNLGIVRRDVDALWNLAPHDISIVLHWLGRGLPEEVVCHGASYLQPDVDDVSFMILRFPGGTLAHIHVSWLDPGKVRRMTVVGSSKMAVYDDTSSDARVKLFDKGIDRQNIDRNLGQFEDFGQFQLIHRAGDLLIPHVRFTEPLREEADHFIACVEDGAAPMAGGDNGLDVLRVLEAARESRRNQGKPVRVRNRQPARKVETEVR